MWMSHSGTNTGTINGMATNLRLRPEAEQALREESKRSGRSQQELLREALEQYLGLAQRTRPVTDAEQLVADGIIRPPRDAYRSVRPRRSVPAGASSSLDLLEREDRV
jgi:ribbon-helix-helix CopG family protein